MFEKYARVPSIEVAPTARPIPPLPREPTGWSSAAGYSTRVALVVLVPGRGDDEDAAPRAQRIARRSMGRSPCRRC